MSRRCRSVLAPLALAVAALGVASCGSSNETVDAADERVIGDLDAAIPTRLAGYRLEEEDIAELLEEGRRPYLEAASLYSIREDDDLLQATLQVGRFADDVDLDDEDFRNLLITNIGSGARPFRMGDTEVYITGADRQTLNVWFDEQHLFILSTRDGFESGRALLREALELQP